MYGANVKRCGWKNDEIEALLRTLMKRSEEYTELIPKRLLEPKEKSPKRRRRRLNEARVQQIMRNIEKRRKTEARYARKEKQERELMTLYRKIPLKQVYAWFDEGISRTTIARRLGVPRSVITYAWDHRYD